MPSPPWSSATRCTSCRGRFWGWRRSRWPSSSSASCRCGWWTGSSSCWPGSSSATSPRSASHGRRGARSSSRTARGGRPCSTSAPSPGSAPATSRSCRRSGGYSAAAPSSSTADVSRPTPSYWQQDTTATYPSGSREVTSSPKRATQGCHSQMVGRESQGSTLLASQGEVSPVSPQMLSRLHRTLPWHGTTRPPQDD